MGIIIKATSIVENSENQGSVELTVQAAKACIASAGITMEDIGILINLGIYKEDNIGEQAMAALIQKQLRLNADPVKQSPAEKTTFCFDLLNGSCGFLNAIQVLEALMKNDQLNYAIIVSSDVHPSRDQVQDFPYAPYGAAVIVAVETRLGDLPESAPCLALIPGALHEDIALSVGLPAHAEEEDFP